MAQVSRRDRQHRMVDLTRVLPKSSFDQDPVRVAQALLGKWLIHDEQGVIVAGRIVETEAYLAANDPASHSHRGQTSRNAVMFGPPGHAYVYAIHRYHCLNVVTEGVGVPSAVLLRAVEPLQGLEIMAARRGTDHYVHLASGPGKLCQAFAIDRTLNRWDCTQGTCLWLAEPVSDTKLEIAVSPRIGVTSAQELRLRFYDAGSACLSRRHRG